MYFKPFKPSFIYERSLTFVIGQGQTCLLSTFIVHFSKFILLIDLLILRYNDMLLCITIFVIHPNVPKFKDQAKFTAGRNCDLA